jgi:hypothetical protein
VLDKVNGPERVSKLTRLPGPKTKLAIRPAILTHHSIFPTTQANSSWVFVPMRKFSKSHCTVCVNGVEMTWDDFVTTYFGVTRRWLNIVLKRYLAPTTTTSETDTEDVDIDEDDNDDDSKAELLHYVKGLDEDEAASLLGQINDGFNDNEEDDDETEEPATAAEDELDEIVPILKRISVNSVSVFARKLELLTEKLGFDDRIRIVVE